jgi:hypothetical protein
MVVPAHRCWNTGVDPALIGATRLVRAQAAPPFQAPSQWIETFRCP